MSKRIFGERLQYNMKPSLEAEIGTLGGGTVEGVHSTRMIPINHKAEGRQEHARAMSVLRKNQAKRGGR